MSQGNVICANSFEHIWTFFPMTGIPLVVSGPLRPHRLEVFRGR